jgi:group I intron endonuclease
MGREKISCIYRISSIIHPEKWYYGSTVNLYGRKDNHIWYLRNNKHSNNFLQNHFNKYGEQDLVFDIVELVDDVTKLIIREQHYLDYYFGWFNICRHAQSRLGFKHPQEWKDNMSKLLTGKVFSEERCRNMSKARIGIKLSNKTKEKMSKARIGKKYCLGYKHSEESCRNMSQNNGMRKIILNTQTGIYYDSIKLAAESLNIKQTTLSTWLTGYRKNKSYFIYA